MDREEAHVKLKSCTGHQWWLVLIDCRVLLLYGRDSRSIRPNGWVFIPEEKQKVLLFVCLFVLGVLWLDIINLHSWIILNYCCVFAYFQLCPGCQQIANHDS